MVGCRSANRKPSGALSPRRSGDDRMAEALRKTSRDRFPGGVVTQYGVGAITVFVLLFLTYWIWFGGGEVAELPGATEAKPTAPKSFTDQMDAKVEAEALRAETQAGGGGSGLAGAAATANQHRQNRCRSSDRQRSASTSRAKPRYRATLHRGRMGTPRALAPGSPRAAQPVASQFANRADLPATGRRRRERCGTGSLTIPLKPSKPKARRR